MSLLDLRTDDTLAAAPRIAAQPRPEPRFSAWSAIPRGVAEAGAQVLASGSEFLGGFGQVLGAYPEAAGYMPTGQAKQQADAARTRLLSQGVDGNTETGNSLRAAGAALRPDPLTASAAEQLLYGFARGASKVVAGALAAGPLGVGFAGLEEANTAASDLAQQGVPFGPRVAAGAVQGAGLALAALPMAGATLKTTAALYAAGGPGGFMAQQALTREILRNAGQGAVAEQFDPFDPVGLAVSALVPLPFAAWGLRANRAAAAARSAEAFRAGPVPSEPTATARAAAEAVAPVQRETVDAALVAHQTQARAAANIHTFGTRSDAMHETALVRAEDQIAQGLRVNVSDLVEPPSIEAARVFDEQIAALEAQRADLLPTAGQLADRGEIAPIKEQLQQMQRQAPDASDEAIKALAKDLQSASRMSYKQALAEAKRQTAEAVAQHDAQIASLEAAISRNAEGQQAAQRLAQIDQQIETLKAQRLEAAPFAAFRTAIAEAAQLALREAPQPRTERAPTIPQAPNPEAAAPARGAGDAPAGAGAAEPGRPAADVQAAGLTPADKAEAMAAAGRMAELQAQQPGLAVMLDGMERPMPLAEFLAQVQREADELLADAPLMELAASCAIVNGS